MTPLTIGTRVITRKFEETRNSPALVSEMLKFIDQEGKVESVSSNGNIEVHGFYWPPSAVEPISPPFQPEYGKEYEFAYDPEFIGIIRAKFIGKDGNSFVAKIDNACQYAPYDYCRPIRKGLEDELKDFVSRKCSYDPEDAYRELNFIIANHRTEPSDEEIKQFWHSLNLRQSILDSVVEATRHFLNQGI